MERRWKTHLAAATVVLGAVAVTGRKAAAEPDVTVALRPSHITVDQSAELRVAENGGKQPTLPHVDGLHFEPAGQSSEMSAINGVVSRHNWSLYRVVADRPGTYDISVAGRSLILEVGPAGGRGRSAVSASSASVPSPASRPSAREGSAPGKLALLHVKLPGGKLYVGQAVPVTFKAYFRAGTDVALSGLPSLGVPAFTISGLDDKPRQSTETIGGVPYLAATWTGMASAAMPGRFTTHATLAIVARYREAPQQQAADPLAGMLDDEDMFSASPSAIFRSFMNRSAFANMDDLFGRVRERDLTLHAPAQTVEVLALPNAGQPRGYQGAVGRFNISASLSPGSGTRFAPMSLRIEVHGQGNLDRVFTPGLLSSQDWKTYPPSAKSTDMGSRVFEQAVVPQRSGHLQIPPVTLSFFDPERKQYLTRSSEPIAVDVASAPMAGALPIVTPTASASQKFEVPAGLRPNHVDEGRFVSTLLPPHRRTWFWPVLALPWFALAAVWLRPRIRLPAARAHRRALHAAIARQRLAMKSAVAAQDPNRFHEAAAAGLRQALGERWQIQPDEVTAAEASLRLGEREPLIVAVLSASERLRYGAAIADPGPLADLQANVERKLEELEERT